MWDSLKDLTFTGCHEKPIRRGDCLKRGGGGLDSLLLQGALGKKGGGGFLRGVDTPVPTMKFLPREKNGKGNASI